MVTDTLDIDNRQDWLIRAVSTDLKNQQVIVIAGHSGVGFLRSACTWGTHPSHPEHHLCQLRKVLSTALTRCRAAPMHELKEVGLGGFQFERISAGGFQTAYVNFILLTEHNKSVSGLREDTMTADLSITRWLGIGHGC